MTNVIILGNGAREHAIQENIKCNTIMRDTKDDVIFMCKKYHIDLVVVGSEKYLVEGIVDELDVDTFGPSKEAAKIEGSKIFSKQFMKTHNIPTPEFFVFNNRKNAIYFLDTYRMKKSYVIKLDKLYGGKGVYLPSSYTEALQILDELYDNNPYEKIIIEEKLKGTECSVMGFCNGKDVHLMPQVMDYKRSDDYDKGLNTGGMGCIGPVNILNGDELTIIKESMLKVVKELDFRGVLYAGVMKTDQGCYILEFNCRFGDPETQVVLNLLDSDLYGIMISCIYGLNLTVKWKNTYCANVVLSHIDYPIKKLSSPVKITCDTIDSSIKLYWSNCFKRYDDLYTYGGRVCSVVHSSNDLRYSLETIYNNIYNINYVGRYYRRDIGTKYLTDHKNTKRIRIGILASGNGTSIVKLLTQRKELNVSVDIIISNKPSSILDKAKECNIPALYLPQSHTNFNKLVNTFKTFDIDVILLVGYNKILSDEFCHYYKGKLVNIHPSLLPDYSGMYDINIHQSILNNNEKVSGCTLHYVTPDVDKGRIILQRQVRVDEINDATILKSKIQELESDVIIDFIKLYQNTTLNYSSSGVDVAGGDDFIEKIKNKHIGSFCSTIELNGKTLGLSTDGVGTKLDLAIKHNKFDTIGIDLVAMCVNDLLVRGITPKLFLDYIAIDKLDTNKLVTIVNSIKKGCSIAECSLIGGETAEMPGLYVANGLDLAGFSVGVLEHDLFPKINNVEKGCKIYGIPSNGIHSNGYSLVRKLLKYHSYDIDTLLKPTRIYMECLDLITKYGDNLLGMAHITGGGLINNTKRIIPPSLEPVFNIDIKDEFKWIMEKSRLNYHEMICTFNCGFGIAFILKKDFECLDYSIIGEIM